MYPYTMYIAYGHSREYRPVVINGYRQGISAESFRSLNVKTFAVLSSKLKSYKPFKYRYSFKYDFDWANEIEVNKRMGVPCDLKAIGNPIDLYDFYDEIGYDKQKKHFNGVTLRRHILNNLGK